MNVQKLRVPVAHLAATLVAIFWSEVETLLMVTEPIFAETLYFGWEQFKYMALKSSLLGLFTGSGPFVALQMQK